MRKYALFLALLLTSPSMTRAVEQQLAVEQRLNKSFAITKNTSSAKESPKESDSIEWQLSDSIDKEWQLLLQNSAAKYHLLTEWAAKEMFNSIMIIMNAEVMKAKVMHEKVLDLKTIVDSIYHYDKGNSYALVSHIAKEFIDYLENENCFKGFFSDNIVTINKTILKKLNFILDQWSYIVPQAVHFKCLQFEKNRFTGTEEEIKKKIYEIMDSGAIMPDRFHSSYNVTKLTKKLRRIQQYNHNQYLNSNNYKNDQYKNDQCLKERELFKKINQEQRANIHKPNDNPKETKDISSKKCRNLVSNDSNKAIFGDNHKN